MLDLEPIKARLAAATPGPWHVEPEATACGSFVARMPGIYIEPEHQHLAPAGNDAALIANAPADIAALVAEVERLTKERDRREGHIRVVLSERITVTRHDEMFVVQVANYADPKKTSSVQRAFLGCDEITSVMTWIPRALSQVAIPGEGEVTT